MPKTPMPYVPAAVARSGADDFAGAVAARAAQQAAKKADDVVAATAQKAKPNVDLNDLLKKSTPTKGKPNQSEIVLNDGTKVVFRRDVGENAHKLDKLHSDFVGKGKIDHYNIEVHTPTQGSRAEAMQKATGNVRRKQKEDLHIIPNKDGGYTLIYKNKNIKKVK